MSAFTPHLPVERERAPEEVLRQRRRQVLVGLGAVAFLIAMPSIPLVRANGYLFAWALIWGLVGLSVNVLTGYAGQMSMAQAALMGSGAFTLGILYTLHGVPYWVALPIAGVVTAAVTVLIGVPALRIRGLHLAIITLGFQFLMNRVVFRQDFLTKGAAGIDVEFPMWIGGRQLTEHWQLLYVIVAVIIVVWILDRNLTRSRGGRAFFAIREDEQVAASFGISVARYKLFAFALSGFYAGLAGALFTTIQRSAGAELYDYTQSFEFLVYGVIGGLGSRAGVFYASMFPIFFRQIFQGLRIWSTVLGGVLLVLTLTRYRGGLAEQGREMAHLATHAWRNRRAVARALLHLPVSLSRKLAHLAGAPVRLWRIRSQIPVLTKGLWQVRRELPAIRRARKQAKISEELAAAAEATLEVDELTPRMTGAAGNGDGRHARELRRPTRGPLLEVADVSIRFGGVQALDGVSLQVREGEIVGLMGPNGAGKTTLFNCISGFAKPNAGSVSFKGARINDLPPHARAVRGFGRTFQNIGLVKSETVVHNFLIAQHAVAGYGPLEGMLRTSAVRRAEEDMRSRAHGTLARLGLEDVADRTVKDLPHGLLKVVELGAALVTEPEILFLDEPSSGMAPPEAEKLGVTLKEIQGAFDVTILMIEHHVPLVLSVADYVYVLNFGKLLAEGEAHEIARHPEVIAAYLGSDDLDLEEAAV